LNPIHAKTSNSLLNNDCVTGKLCQFENGFYRQQRHSSRKQFPTVKKETKFLDQIDVPVESSKGIKEKESEKPVAKKETEKTRNSFYRESNAENLSALQVKYAVLLNTPAEEVKNPKMFEFIDDWYGSPYRLGGTTKKGVDCSAFSQFLFASVYGLSIPRNCKRTIYFDQSHFKNRIKRRRSYFL
jgi:cell wall-associated NlpC family hydrolase